MNAKPGQNIIVSKETLRHVQLAQDLQGIAAVILSVIAVLLWTLPKPLPEYPIMNKVPHTDAMFTSCTWPKNEGEMTVITVVNGQRVCWRWR